MKWSEVRRKAEEDGWVLVRFGERKGLLQNKETVKFEIV